MPLPRVLEPEVMYGADQAGEYDEMDFSATDQLFAERAAQLAARAATVVDLGSGNAKIPLAMCPLLAPEIPVYAVEMSREMLNVAARNRAREGVTPRRLGLIAADCKRLPFADASAGAVTSNSLVHHIPEPRDLLREIARIAAPGAPILIRDLYRPPTEQEIERLLNLHAAGCSPLQRGLFADSFHAALTVEEVRSMLDECGLRDVTVSQITDRHWSAERAAQ